MSKLLKVVWVEPSGAERRAIRPDAGIGTGNNNRLSRAVQNEEPLGSDYVVAADFNPLGMLRNHLRAVGSAHIPPFQIFKNVTFIM